MLWMNDVEEIREKNNVQLGDVEEIREMFEGRSLQLQQPPATRLARGGHKCASTCTHVC
jgi:hypothetical protein